MIVSSSKACFTAFRIFLDCSLSYQLEIWNFVTCLLGWRPRSKWEGTFWPNAHAGVTILSSDFYNSMQKKIRYVNVVNKRQYVKYEKNYERKTTLSITTLSITFDTICSQEVIQKISFIIEKTDAYTLFL